MSAVTGLQRTVEAILRNERSQRIERWLERLLLALSGVYLAFCALERTTFFVPFPAGFAKVVFAALVPLALLRLPFVGLRRVEPWIGLALLAICFMVYRWNGYGFILFIAVMSIGFIGIDYRRILNVYLLAVGGALVAAVIAALTGSIANIINFRDGIRSSWGVCYPTDFSSWALFLLLFLWAGKEGMEDWLALVLCALSIVLSAFVTQSRNSLICSVLLFALIVYHGIETRLLRDGRHDWLRRGTDGLLLAAFPSFAALSFVMVYLYGRGTAIGYKLDGLMSDRLAQTWKAYQFYGISPFGAPVEQIGRGFSMVLQASVDFVDSSYALILLRDGWVYFLAAAGLWTWTLRRVLRGGNRRLALAMGVIAFHSFMEHHFTEYNFNILIAMPLAGYAALPAGGRPREDFRERTIATALTLAVVCVAAWLGLPGLLTWLRTVTTAAGWRGGGWNSVPALLVALMLAAVASAAAWSLYRLIRSIVGRQFRWRLIAPLLACAILAGVGGLCGEGILSRAARTEAETLRVEAEAIDLITGAADGGVYVDDLPVVYMRRFGSIAPTALAGDDLARLSGATAIMDVGEEHNTFFKSGFLFAQLSDGHAVYTGDAAVVEALTAAGYAVTDYYSAVRQVDLAEEAELNGLPIDEHGLLLDGPTQSLLSGPSRDLYSGTYEVKYSLFLPDQGEAEDDLVCRIRACSSAGENVISESPVYRGQFDADGRFEASMIFAIGDVDSAEFLVYASQGWQVYVGGIEYRKIAA